MVRDRFFLWSAGIIFLLTAPARFAQMNSSLWLDEAWVANSLLSDSLRNVFFTKDWAQSSPPLFLLLERGMTHLAGVSEPALRIFPLLAAIAGLVLAAIAFRQWLSGAGALVGFTLLAVNYWLIKYPMQVKQYATDFFVSVVLFYIMGRFAADPRSRRKYAALLLAGSIGLFLAYPTAFWLPGLVAISAIPMVSGISRNESTRIEWRRLLASATVLGLSFLLVEFLFIRPNSSAALEENWRVDLLDPSHPLLSLWKLAGSLGVLLTFPGRQAEFAGLCVYGLIVSAGVLAVREIRAGKTRGVIVVLAGLSPVAAAVAAGALRLYPVLEYPRMLLFLLPSLAFLAGYVVDRLLPHVGLSEPLTGKWKIALPAACALGAIASQAVFLLVPHASEENLPAVRYIQARLRPDDLLYIHGGMYEQFEYYTKRLDFHPHRIYVGKPDWPCCATGDLRKPTSPQAASLSEDLKIAAQQSQGHNLWLLMPAGSPGHWSAGLRAEFEEVPQMLASDHCTAGGRQQFGQTLVESWSCR